VVDLLLVSARWGRAIVFFGDDGSSDSTSNTSLVLAYQHCCILTSSRLDEERLDGERLDGERL
jgi:hypothetical protein